MAHEATAPMGVNTVAPQIVMMPAPALQGQSQRMTCPHCQADITTVTNYENGRMTHIAALLLCIFGCWCCCCIPYFVDSCKDAEHECPNCHRHIGTCKR